MARKSGRLKIFSVGVMTVFVFSLVLCSPLKNSPTIQPYTNPQANRPTQPQTLPRPSQGGIGELYFEQLLDPTFLRVYNNSQDMDQQYGLDGTFYHVMSPDWNTVVGPHDKYTYDNLFYNTGLLYYKASIAVPGLVNQTMVNTPLFDPTVGAFRVKIDENGTNPTNTYTMEDNAMALYAMSDYDSISDDATVLTQQLWNYLNSSLLVYSPNLVNYIFMPQNGTPNLTDVNVSINLLGSLVNSYVAQNPTLAPVGSPVYLQSQNISQIAFTTVNGSTFKYFDGGLSDKTYEGFEDYLNFNHDMSLKTNALGIACLADLYMRSGRQNTTELTQADEVYHFIDKYFYNNTGIFASTPGYVDQVDNQGQGTTNRISLAGNAWWLFALAKLFEASGNLTYYQKAIQVYNETVNNFWDSANFGFNRSISCYGNDSTKSVGDNCFFYFALRLLDQAYKSTSLSIILPDSQLTAFQDTAVTINCNYNMSWSPNSFAINLPIANASITLNLRYPNETLITQIVSYTDVNGNFTITYPLPANLPLGTYTIYAFANLTGYGTAESGGSFTIVGNISLTQYDTPINIVQGNLGSFNVSFASTRNNSFIVNLTGVGQGCTIISQNYTLVNATTTPITVQLNTTLDAPIGQQNITLTLTNQSMDIMDIEVPIKIMPAVALSFFEFPETIVPGVPVGAYVTLQNMHQAPEVASFALFGKNIQAVSQNVALQAGETKRVYLALQTTGYVAQNMIPFTLNVTRYSQTMSSTNYTIQEVTALQIQDITASTQVPQGHALYIAVQAFNNLNTTQSVDIYVNGKPWQIGVAILPGANNIFLTLDPLNSLYPIVWNPYDLGTHNVNVTVIANGATLVTQNFAIQSTVPIENVLLFYVLPVIIPIAAVLISYQRKKKREMLR